MAIASLGPEVVLSCPVAVMSVLRPLTWLTPAAERLSASASRSAPVAAGGARCHVVSTGTAPAPRGDSRTRTQVHGTPPPPAGLHASTPPRARGVSHSVSQQVNHADKPACVSRSRVGANSVRARQGGVGLARRGRGGVADSTGRRRQQQTTEGDRCCGGWWRGEAPSGAACAA